MPEQQLSSEEARARIEEHRAGIDEIDRKLVALLNERAGLSLAIRALKPAAGMDLYDPAREQRIFSKVCGFSDGTLYDQGLCEIYETLLKVMKENPFEIAPPANAPNDHIQPQRHGCPAEQDERAPS